MPGSGPGTTGRLLALVALIAVLVVPAASTPDTTPAPSPDAAAAPAAPTPFALEDWPLDAAAERGKLVYETRCIGCHGETGRGDGPAARWLNPLPRDFQRGNFKFRSTPSGELPTPEDLLHVVTCGLAGSSMPPFPLLSEGARRDVVDYVLHIAEYGMLKAEVDDRLEDGETWEEIQADEWGEFVEEILFDGFEEAWPVSVPLEPELDEDTVAEGAELYQAQCVACHGASGRGDGPSSFTLRDWKDAEVIPRDLTTGVFRAGSKHADLFLRMRTGVNGTPMPEIYGSDDELWSLVHYIVSLQDESTRVDPHPVSCAAHDQEANR